MTNSHLITAKYVGATNTKGSRVKLTSLRFPGDSLITSLDYSASGIKDQALMILKALGYKVNGYGYDEVKGQYIFFSSTFEPLKEQKKTAKMLSERGWHKDHYNYNRAEKWERTPAKRKTVARNVAKTAARKTTPMKKKR
jgi:hypothetical protein